MAIDFKNISRHLDENWQGQFREIVGRNKPIRDLLGNLLQECGKRGIDIHFLAASFSQAQAAQRTSLPPEVQDAVQFAMSQTPPKRTAWVGNQLYLLWYVNPNDKSQTEAELLRTLDEGRGELLKLDQAKGSSDVRQRESAQRQPSTSNMPRHTEYARQPQSFTSPPHMSKSIINQQGASINPFRNSTAPNSLGLNESEALPVVAAESVSGVHRDAQQLMENAPKAEEGWDGVRIPASDAQSTLQQAMDSPQMKTKGTALKRNIKKVTFSGIPEVHEIPPFDDTAREERGSSLRRPLRKYKSSRRPMPSTQIPQNDSQKSNVRFILPSQSPNNPIALRDGYLSLEKDEYVDDNVIGGLFEDWNRYNAENHVANEQDVYFMTPAEMATLGLNPNPAVDPTNPTAQGLPILEKIQHRMLVLPINHGEIHWTIAVYDRCKGEIEHADSSSSSYIYTEHAKDVLSNVYARDAYAEHAYPNRPIQGVFLSHDVPKQKNSFDCGLHILGTAAGIQDKRNGVNPDFALENSVPFDRETLQAYLAAQNPSLTQANPATNNHSATASHAETRQEYQQRTKTAEAPQKPPSQSQSSRGGPR